MSAPRTVPCAVDVAVVGAGASGLVCAAALVEARARYSVAVLDARPRIGGRLLSKWGVDFGGSWSWPSHDGRVAQLARSLELEQVPQRLDGEAFAHQRGSMRSVGNSGVRMAPCGGGAVRFRGGYTTLTEALAAKLPQEALMLNCKVVAVAATDDGCVRVTYADANGETVELLARRVVVAAPPGVVAATMTFTPALPNEQRQKQAATATWCGDWCKVVAIFRKPFWRDLGASGVVATPGPASIWWEAGGGAEVGEESSALVGLGVGPETRALAALQLPGAEAQADAEALRAVVVETLGGAFGVASVEEHLAQVAHKCWIADPLTYAAPTASGAPQHRDYGHSLLRRATPWGVHFAGTETEDLNGHVEGAIAAGQRAAAEVEAALGAALE